jgi:Mg2+-importing ATPase
MPDAPESRNSINGGPADWSDSEAALFSRLASRPEGLSKEEAKQRLLLHGPNRLASAPRNGALALLLRQFASPIIVILLGAALLSFLLHSPTDGLIIVAIVTVSALLGLWQEHRATTATARLLDLVEPRCHVRRDGRSGTIPREDLVPGDLVLLAAGAAIPADCRLLDEQDLCVDEAAITGESFPVEKQPGPLPTETPLAARANLLHHGSHVVSGSGTGLVLRTGRATTLGAIAEQLRQTPGETEFERGVRRFGTLLLELTLVLIALIFAFNVYLQRPVSDSFLFALALGVGLTPQLLPAILTVNLARGAQAMARRRVIVKRLAAIEDFGSMDVLCTDKTGTLTEGKPRVRGALAADGGPGLRVLPMAQLNAGFETGTPNPIDDALRELGPLPPGWHKCDEKPFDFHRKRQSLLLTGPDGQTQLITKGAVATVLEICDRAERSDGQSLPLADLEAQLQDVVRQRSAAGERLLAVACRPHAEPRIGADSEAGMTFLGMVALVDPLKPGIAETVRQLAALGVGLKMVSGDSAAVAQRVAKEAGLDAERVITGADLLGLRDEALPLLVRHCQVFAEVEPNQKERLIRALRRTGHGVGYLGDGINDAPAMHAADVSLSVQGAVDVAREAADIVLLEKDLGVLIEGIREGRRSFANTLKYVFMATSANFGNMLSMAVASLLLPFLPLLPKQILLTNLLTDLPEMTIAGDRVDADWVERPRSWDIAFIRRFMFSFGLVSSLYDGLTFAVLLLGLGADRDQLRTGWFVESVISAAMVVLVVRSRGPIWRSRPSRGLAFATLAVIGLTLLLPASPLGGLFGFVPLPPAFLGPLALILLAYGLTAEATKALFYKNENQRR